MNEWIILESSMALIFRIKLTSTWRFYLYGDHSFRQGRLAYLTTTVICQFPEYRGGQEKIIGTGGGGDGGGGVLVFIIVSHFRNT